MDDKEKQLLQRLLSLFKVEAGEHLKAISSGLIELEKAGQEKQPEILEVIYREAHSLKGAARSVNLPKIAALCQSLENVFSAVKRSEIELSLHLFDVLHQTLNTMGIISTMGEEETSIRIGELLQDLGNIVRGKNVEVKNGEAAFPAQEPSSSPIPAPLSAPPFRAGGLSESEIDPCPPTYPSPGLSPAWSSMETIRISTRKLDSLLFQTEELLGVKMAFGQRLAEMKELRTSLDRWRKDLQKGRYQEGEPFRNAVDTQLTSILKSIEYDHRFFGGMIDTLMDEMKKVLMLPFSSLSDLLPKFVRDLSRELGKDVEIIISGSEIEVDRRILEEMKDPVIHLVRNCLDHGIEEIPERKRKNKTLRGKIELTVKPKNGHKLEVVISDDGAGIDTRRLKSAAIRHGFLSREETEKIDDQDILPLIFRSGLTTSPIITDISGRGLGLAIVREKVEKLSGRILVETGTDKGTTFRVTIPLTLATFRGVLISVGEQSFIFPTTHVERVLRIRKDGIKTVENRETILSDGRILSLIRMKDVLELKSTGNSPPPRIPESYLTIVVLGSAEKRLAFLVDEILEECEVLVKPLGKQLSRVRNIAGATVLGSGRIVPILNVSDIMKSAVTATTTPMSAAKEVSWEKRKSILIVEDSITARTLLKNILTTAGYDVQTSVDGVDAVSALRTRTFDLVVSDVQMPRMDGFDLVKSIRQDKKFSELPVILVTGLESTEDRKRGIDVGADAYIVKSSFDQSNLLEVIGRLI